MTTLPIQSVEEITKCEDIEMYGVKTESEFTYEFELNFNDSNFGKKKGWLKDEGAKWDANKKVWVLKSKRLPRHLTNLITRIY